MAMIDPKSGKQYERDPEEGNIPTGLYLCELTRVTEVGPSPKYPQSNPRLVFEFTICDPNHPHLNGRKPVQFVGKTLLSNKEGRESALVKLARMMGVVNPQNGFDPDTLIGKKYNVMVEYTPGVNGEAGRGWARSAMVAANQVASTPNQQPVNQSPPTQQQQNFVTPGARWDYTDGDKVRVSNASTEEVHNFITGNQIKKDELRVKPAGQPTTAAKYAEEFGFSVYDSIPW